VYGKRKDPSPQSVGIFRKGNPALMYRPGTAGTGIFLFTWFLVPGFDRRLPCGNHTSFLLHFMNNKFK